ncbi:MAG: DUF11 domain-containing protein [Burkholderiales bacterium]|nr:DUF11 domain-containing protein [Burkholderiales bacterium]
MTRTFIRFVLGLVLAVLALLPGSVLAASACTAMWAILSTNHLAWYNTSTSDWVTTTVAIPGGNPNALAGDTTSRLLYMVDRTTRNLYSYDPVTNVVSASIGTIPAPPAPATAGNVLGATFDLTGKLYVYATQGSPNPYVAMAQISTATAATVTSWTQILTTAGATPLISGSGDMNMGADGVAYIISNTTPPTYHVVDLTTARTNSPALVITGAGNVGVAGAAVNPIDGQIYFGTSNSGSTTYILNPLTGVATLAQSTTAYTIADMGNCPFPPAAPTVSKTFSPTVVATGSTTVKLTLGNANTAPIYLNADFKDILPSSPQQMEMYLVPNLQGSCLVGGNSIIATAGSTSMTFASGGQIPAGGCTISFVVDIAAPGTYTNVIGPGALVTTVGSNPTGVTATVTGPTTLRDFLVDKTQRTDTVSAFTTSTLSIGTGDTIQYQITIFNSGGVTGSTTFTDTLPTLITPVLSVTATPAGGGACTTATAVVGGSTVVTGSFNSAPVGATCTVLITAFGRALGTPTTVQNTTSVATDNISSNNDASIFTTLTPVAPTVTKSFTPAITTNAPATSTLLITFGNTNAGPVTLTTAFKDILPSSPGQMRIHNTPSLQGSCAGPVAPAGSTSVTWAAGNVIPAGGCTISFAISVTVAGDFLNTIQAGSVTTAAGNNALDGTATFTANLADFTVTKAQRTDTSAPFVTSTLTVVAGQTLQYQLTIVNLGVATASATFTDTLPTLATPLVSISAVQTGGGSCTTATAVVGGRTQLTGTILAAPTNATCTVLITTFASTAVGTPTSFQNTVTLAAFGSIADIDSTDNGATVTTTISPIPPTISKFFSPTFSAANPGTSTLYIVITNSNTAAITVTTIFRDLLPTTPGAMRVHNTPSLGGTCAGDAAGAASTSITWAANSVIPAGGCTTTVSVSTTVAGEYNNSIPAGSLTTSAGSNAAQATATFARSATDFTVTKDQRAGSSGAFTTANTTIGAGLTIQYQLTITNTGFANGSVTFTDTLPTLITPLLSVTATPTGGATCSTATLVVGGRNQILGTVTNAPPNSFCTILITARGSATVAVTTTLQNTVTIVAVGGIIDPDSSNNNATVTTTISPVANLQVTKTNNVSALATGQTTSYTITVSNLGPANAPGTTVVDGTVTGLTCADPVVCSFTGTAGCPVSPTLAALQSPGLTIPTLNSGSSVSLVFTCLVNATGF